LITLNNVQVNPTIFPDNTSQVWKLSSILPTNNEIWWYFEKEEEVLHLLQLVTLLKRNPLGLKIYIPYLPYARQDHLVDNEKTFALSTFKQIMSIVDVPVYIFDVHSYKGVLSPWFYNIEPDLSFTKDYDVVCFPDVGAKERYKHLVKNQRIIYGNKVRDSLTGFITHYDVSGKYKHRDRIIVIDDICDGGATFRILSESLDTLIKPDLYVSHGIFSRGVGELFEQYHRIMTTDSFITERYPDVYYYNVSQIMKRRNV